MIVVDASIFVKLFKQEEDSDVARSSGSLTASTMRWRSRRGGIIDYGGSSDKAISHRRLQFYESLSAALHVELRLDKVGSLFNEFRELGLAIEEPTTRRACSGREDCK